MTFNDFVSENSNNKNAIFLKTSDASKRFGLSIYQCCGKTSWGVQISSIVDSDQQWAPSFLLFSNMVGHVENCSPLIINALMLAKVSMIKTLLSAFLLFCRLDKVFMVCTDAHHGCHSAPLYCLINGFRAYFDERPY